MYQAAAGEQENRRIGEPLQKENNTHIYEQTYEDLTGGNWKMHFDVKEQQVYGSGRVGVRNGDDEGKYYQQFSGTKSGGMFNSISYTSSSSAYSKTHYSRTLGLKQYSESDHLGNVQVTVSDKRLPYSSTPSTATSVDYYLPDVISNASYYCFGSLEPGRSGGTQGRWGFNGKENDNEIHNVQGSAQDYGMRMYDNRVGRFFSSDPLKFKYPYLTPYQFASNTPIEAIDLDGAEAYHLVGTKNTVSVTGPDGINYDVPSGGNPTYDKDGVSVTSYSWDSPDGGQNTLTWHWGNNGNQGYGLYEYSYVPSEVVLAQQNGSQEYHLPSDKEWAQISTVYDNPDDPFGYQAQYNAQQSEQARLAKELANEKASLMNYYEQNYTFGKAVYWAQQSDKFSESKQAATYIGGTLKLSVFWAAPVGEVFGFIGEGTGIILTSNALKVGFSSGALSVGEETILLEASQIMGSTELQVLRQAANEGISAEVMCGGRKILFEPEDFSGLTLFTENGFVIGKNAFASDEELAKTLLHELYRLTYQSSSTGGVVGGSTSATIDAADFANTAIRYLKLSK